MVSFHVYFFNKNHDPSFTFPLNLFPFFNNIKKKLETVKYNLN